MARRKSDSFPTFESAMSLVNSKKPEQMERGLSLLERGEFLQPDSAKHLDSMLAALTHPRTSGSAAIRQNVLRPLPALLHKCGSAGSGRSTFWRIAALPEVRGWWRAESSESRF